MNVEEAASVLTSAILSDEPSSVGGARTVGEQRRLLPHCLLSPQTDPSALRLYEPCNRQIKSAGSAAPADGCEVMSRTYNRSPPAIFPRKIPKSLAFRDAIRVLLVQSGCVALSVLVCYGCE